MPSGLARAVATALVLWLSLCAGAQAGCGGTSLIGRYVAEAPNDMVRLFKQARAVPNARGRFWEVQHGSAPPSYLFGTFHTSEALATVPEPVWGTLVSARLALFEVDLEEKAALEQRMSQDPDFIVDRLARPLAERLEADERAVVAEALNARGMTLDGAAQLRPWLLMSLLGFPVCQLQAVASGAEPMDMVMAERARAAGVDIAGLERYAESIAAFERIPPDLLMAGIVSAARSEAISEDVFRTHADLYAAGDIQMISEFAVWLGERLDPEDDLRGVNDAMMAEILDRRNVAWMPVLERELLAGDVFVGVGALHLPGEAGLIELLRARGFTVRRLDGS